MTPNIDRLKKVAEHLRNGKLGHDKFYFASISKGDRKANGCGTMGCAMGELPIIFPNDWKFEVQCDYIRVSAIGEDVLTGDDAMTEFFGLSRGEIDHLFYPSYQNPARYGGKHLGGMASKEEVASNIEAFIATCGAT